MEKSGDGSLDAVLNEGKLPDLQAVNAAQKKVPGRFRRAMQFMGKPLAIIGISVAAAGTGTVLGTAYSDSIRQFCYEVERSYDFFRASGDNSIVDDFGEKDALYKLYHEGRSADVLRDRVCGVVNIDKRYECKRVKP